MELHDLQRALEHEASSQRWVSAITRFFESYALHYGHGTDNAADEAYWLVRARQQWRDEAWESPPDRRLIADIVQLAQRRVTERMPLAYLVGEAWFAGLRLVVDQRVLVPRSPLAELIERGFGPWCRLAPGDVVLDIGTGSGAIAVAAACHCAGIMVDATDVSPDALAVARGNVAAFELQDRVHLFESDLFPPVPTRYRLIVSNPPYVPAQRLAALPAEYQHEPAGALAAGTDGLACIERILAGAADHLTPDGILIVEVGEAQGAFVEAYPRLPVTWLEFERGGDGVLLLTRSDLTGYLEG